jgi:hypothetical protein
LVSVGAKLQSEIGYAIRVQSRMLEEKSREVANMLIPIELHFGKLLESKEHGGLKRLRPLVEMEWQLVEATKDSEVLIDSFLMPQVKRLLYDIQERRQALGLLLEKEEFEGFEEEHIVHSIERINRQREEFLRQESGELAQTMDKLNTEAQKGLLADYFKQVDTIEEFLEAEFQNVQIAIEENKRLEEQVYALKVVCTARGEDYLFRRQPGTERRMVRDHSRRWARTRLQELSF